MKDTSSVNTEREGLKTEVNRNTYVLGNVLLSPKTLSRTEINFYIHSQNNLYRELGEGDLRTLRGSSFPDVSDLEYAHSITITARALTPNNLPQARV